MPRSYFRTVPDLYERKMFGSGSHPPYTTAQGMCFIGVLCFAEQQPIRGRFKSRRVLAALLEGPRGEGRSIARQIGFLIEQGDLIEQPDGSLYVEGWDELQEGNWQVAERMQRYRARKGSVTVATVTPLSSVTDDPSRVVSGKRIADSEGLVDAAASPPRTQRQVVHRWLTDHGANAPVGWVNTNLNELVKVYGASRIVALWESASADVRTSRQYVQFAERSLSGSSKQPGGHSRSQQEIEDAFSA